MKEKIENNIDKDIELLKEIPLVPSEYIDEDGEDVLDMFITFPITQNQLVQAIRNVLADRETWKKIAEKLALRYADYLMDYEGRTGEKNHLIPTTAEKLLDWARNEVENEKNNSNT